MMTDSDLDKREAGIAGLSDQTKSTRGGLGMVVIAIAVVVTTSLTVALAVGFPAVYENATVSSCGTGPAHVETLIWLAGVPSLLLALLGRRMAGRGVRHPLYRIILDRCVWFDVLSLLVPWVWASLDRFGVLG